MCSSLTAIWKTIAVYSMVMSLLMAILSAFSIVTYECYFPDLLTYEATNTYLVYVAYFFNPECLNLSTPSQHLDLNTEPGHRTWCWSIGYLTLNIVWFLSSVQLYVVPKYWEEKAGRCLTTPWILTTFAVLAADVAACVIYSSDYEKFETLDSFISNMGLNASAQYPTDYFPLMIVIIFLAFSKAIIFWIINLICFITICVLFVKVGRPDEATIRLETRSAPMDFYYPTAATNPAFHEDISEVRELSSPYETSYDNYNDQLNNEDRWRMDMQRQLIFQQQQQQQQVQKQHQQQQYRHQQIEHTVQSPTDSLEGWSVYTGSPKSILKTPQKALGVRYAPQTFSSHEPWTYLPPDSSREYRAPTNSNSAYHHQNQRHEEEFIYF